MDKPPPDDLDPYRLVEQAAKGARNPRKRPNGSADNESPDDGFLPDHEQIPAMKSPSGFSVFFQWVCGVAASLVTIGIVWIASICVSTARNVDVLLDRPEAVPRWLYENDIRQVKDDANETKRRIAAIEQRQMEALARSRGQ